MPATWRIVEWLERYEVNKDGKPARGDQPLRQTSLPYIRFKADGLSQGEGYRELLDQAGPQRACRTFGLFAKLLEIAGCRGASRRGWILTGRDETMGCNMLARKLGFDSEQVSEDLTILSTIGWIEIAECDWAVCCEKPVSCASENVKMGNSPLSVKLADASADCGQPVSCSAENVKMGNSPLAAKKAEASDRNRSRIEGEGYTEGFAAGGELAAGGSRSAETQQPNSGSDSDSDSGGSGSCWPEESEIGDREDRGSQRDRADRDSEDRNIGRGQQLPEGRNRPFDFDGGREGLYSDPIDVETEWPGVILNGTSEDEMHTRLQVLERAMRWMRELLPHLDPPVGAGVTVRKQAAGDVTSIENMLEAAFKDGGGPAVVGLIRLMQDKKRDVAKSRGRLHSLMAVWMAAAKKQVAKLARSP